ncbi:puratrophin-1 isoform X3 [Peromyscus maniculatus bairdii]|uniref:puratrophin-1 isoform X3 n=1 Tax=Peromyscus maniculatus bairdii TaxID=230844 RepID=UPI003FD2BED5
MEGPLEAGDASSPDSQGLAADGRLAVGSFRNTQKEEPAPQIQASRPAVRATQGRGLQGGGSLSKKPNSRPEQRAADGSGDCQGSMLGGPPVQSEEPAFSGVENLLCPMSSHLSLTQDDHDYQGGGLVGDPGPGKELPAGLSPLSEMSPKLLEADPSGSSFPKPADCLLAQDLTWELLASGMAALPGTRDAEGRAVLLLCAHSPAWLHPRCNSHELLSLLFYLRGILRSEVQALGLTVLVDARICSPNSSLIWGLSQLQQASPGSVHQVLLVGKMPEEMPTGLQFNQLPSHQSLLAHIPDVGLPTSLGGCLPYSHPAWLDFRMRLETLQQNCQETCALLQGVIDSVRALQQPVESGDTGQLLQQAQSLMRRVLESPQLSWLQNQGSLELARLKQGMPEVTLSPDYRSAVDKADELYGQVDGLLHQLTLQSNQRMQALELLQTLEAQEGGLHQVEVWLQEVGWPGLEEPGEPSLDMLLQAQGPFQELDKVAQEQVKQGEKLLQPLVGWEAAELGPPGKRFLTLRSQLTEFSRALAQRRQRLADAEKLFQFFKQATAWTEEGQRVLTELEQEHPGVVLQRLQLHWTRHPDLPPAHFRKMWALATGLGSEGIRQECRWAWAQCQDTWLALDQKLEAALKPPATNSTATLCVRRAPAVPTIPPLRKAYSFDRNLGHAHHGHCAAVVTDSHRPEAGEGVWPRSSPSVPLSGSSDFRNPNRLQLVLAEMVATEREYVRALDYTMQNYFPELDRPDVPQGLRGQRAHLFGNLEKLRDFHYHFFLRELEACTQHPPRVAYAFLRHVNLKEQGQLVRQDEFTVRAGRHKSCRRVFLFEELLLFSKPRRGPAGVDIFTYKRSFKMADLGLTECCGESKLRFEIWFRRRKARDLFVLQASNVATKQAWTADISRLLWRQAIHNKEVRMAEMASMGVGNKAFWDIAPSEEAINDRNINYVLKRRDVRSRASIAVAPFDSDNPYLGALGSLPGDRASCSVLGSLNLHLYRDPALLGVHCSLYPPNFPEEAALEAEAELGSQPSLTPEDSEVSSQCPSASGSSSSDSSCVSGQTLGRGLEDLSYV